MQAETPHQVRRAGAMAVAASVLFLVPALAFSQPTRKEFRYTVAPGTSLTVVNLNGPVTVRGVSGRQVLITATIHSSKVTVDSSQQGNRVEVWSQFTDQATSAERRVEYEVSVPMNTNVTVRAASGPIRVERLRSGVILEGDEAPIHVQEVSNGHVHARTLSGAIVLSNVSGTAVELRSTSGDIRLSRVSASSVKVTSTKGNIYYDGEFGMGGSYVFFNHSGNIEVSLAETASVDLVARSQKGPPVQNEVPMQQKQQQPSYPARAGSTFIGTSHSGSSSVQLHTFSGTIRVKKAVE
ncbi:MAG: DUF4097 family beta strand repeat-containing protein [Terriglobales bacterium]